MTEPRFPSSESWSRRGVLLGSAALIAACASAPSQTEPSSAGRQTLRDRIAARRAAKMGAGSDIALPTDLPETPFARPGAFSVETSLGEWTDAARGGRQVLWKLYRPAGAAGAVPIVIFSHGGGGTRDAAAQWGEHVASHGIACLHPQHIGSDRDAFRENAREIAEAATYANKGEPRFRDIQFTLAQIKAGAAGAGLDVTRSGVFGHSFGAIASQIAAGQIVEGYGQALAVPDFKAALTLSPSPPRAGYGKEETAFADMLMPVFHITGSLDDAPNGDFKAPARRVPFDRTSNVDQGLLWLEGANHFTFGGSLNPELRGQSFAYEGLQRHHALVRAAIAAWWRARLTGDGAAQDFLDTGLKKFLSGADTLEAKRA